MKKLSLLMLLSVFVFWGCSNDDDEVKNEVRISFENQLTEKESEFTTDQGSIVDPNDQYSSYTYPFKSPDNRLEFSYYYWDYDKSFAGGFTYTNKTDITTPGYKNISAITGKGKYGKVYLTSKTDAFTVATIKNIQPDQYQYKGAWVTNSTYAYLAIKDGNDGYKNETKFEANDWFKLTAVGHDVAGTEIGKIDFYLADYRNGKKEIVNTWQWFDWTPIANASYITFELSSTDNDPEQGMNTPAYFCLDGITLIEK
ncbi:DUF4465 domain-containing protein [Bacteroides nordii]|uniref:DUF4465 domain-containing protein n=1 Tax=Bacteroides nordii TaxID=291645 RepID=UPI00189FCF6F|nr:DUF4465 domain-containing protein [Bacteroides nordii]